MAEIPDLTFKMNAKTSTPAKSSAESTTNIPVVRFQTTSVSGSASPTVKLTQAVPIQILRVEDKSSGHHQQMTDLLGRPMGVTTQVPVGISPTVNSNTGNIAVRKKTGSSFQITSVTDGSRLSNDGGDDSADDLDESHTDDLSSELGVDISKTDYEYSSSDAFSSIKDDPTSLASHYTVHQTQQPLGSGTTQAAAPQISVFTTTHSVTTSAASTTVDSANANVSVTVVESPATVPMSVVQNPDIQWQNRFRVVKIESSEPFRRGRWLCMDFLDPAPPTSSHIEGGDKETSTVSGINSGGNGSGNSSGTNSLIHGESLVIEHAGGTQAVITSTWSIEPSAHSGAAGSASMSVPGAGTGLADRGPPNINVGVNCDHYPVSIILQTQQQGNVDFTNTALHMQGRTAFVPQGYNVAAPILSNSEYTFTSNVPTNATPATVQDYSQQPSQQQSSNISMSQATQPDLHVVSSQVIGHHPISSSSSATSTDYVSNVISQAPQSQQGSMVYPPPPTSNTDYSQQQQQQQSVTVQPINSQIVNTSAPVIVSQPQQQQPPPTSQCYIQQVAPTAVNVTASSVLVQDAIQPTEIAAGPPQSSPLQAGAVTVPTAAATTVMQQAASTTASGGAAGASVTSPSQETADGSQQVVQPNSGEEGEAESLKALAAFLGEGHRLPGSSKCCSVSPVDDSAVVTSGKYSSSGASTVAIDNKIEQAMDLVKSHLMFAVREEVDVLKEKITELMERINQLEFENTILKAAASPETLSVLANSQTPNQSST